MRGLTAEQVAKSRAEHGENVLTVIQEICETYQLGFKVTPSGSGGFSFKLYAGTDRSHTQNAVPPVVFSPKYENISETILVENSSGYKNTACVYNEYTKRIEHQTVETKSSGGYDYEDTITTYEEVLVKSEVEVYNGLGAVSGLDRKEIYIDSSKSHKKDDDTEYTQAEYNSILTAEGKDTLGDYAMTAAFTGTLEPYRQFVLGRDFDMGDIVSIENEYGKKGRCRVIEIIHHSSSSGESVYPSFENADSDKITS